MTTQIIEEILFEADKADSLGKVKKSLKEIKGALLTVEEGSEAFNKLTNAAAELKDKVEDANAAIERANPDKFTGLASAAKIAATGIQLTTGAMALFGDQSEDTQKALMKVQAAMMFAEGLQSVKELDKEFDNLAKTIKANPVFAVAAALIAIGAAAYQMYQNYKQANSEATRLKQIAEQTKKIGEESVFAGEQELAIMQARGESAFNIHEKEKEILANKIKIAEASLASANATLLELKSSDSLYESSLKILIAFNKKIGLDSQAAAAEKELAENQKERFGEAEKAQIDAAHLLETLKTEAIVSDAKYQKVVVDAAKKTNDDKKKSDEEYLKEIDALKEKNRRENTDKDLLALQDYQKEQQTFLENNIISTEEYNARITKSDQEYAAKKKAAEEQEWNDAIAQSEKEMGFYEETLDDEYALLKANNKKKAEEDKKAADLRKQLNSQALSDASSIFGTLAEFSKKNAKLQKGFAVGQATINTFQGVSKALASYPPPFSFLAAAAQLAAGLLQVKNILAVNETGGGGSSGGGGVGSPPSLDAINTAPQGVQPSTQLDENGNRIGQTGQQQQPSIRVHVVESDITATQHQVAVTENAMRFE